MTERQPFRWQAATQANYLTMMKKDYLLVAVPGAGKTFWAMHTARELMKAGRIERIAIVVPTTHVKGQWARTAHELGLNIEPDYRNQDGAWPRDADGVSMTYSQMYENRALHQKNIAMRPTLVVLDEVHHLGEKAAWGQAAKDAFEMAAYRIHLSGTPWNRGSKIPWLQYEGDIVKADYSYSYHDSLTDRVNCDVFFPEMGGHTEWAFDGQIFRHTFDEKLDEEGRARRLLTALSIPESDYVTNTFRQADQELSRIRGLPRQDKAGGLIVAMNKDHADKIADLIDRANYPRPLVVYSELPDASRNLRNFGSPRCTDRWLIAVRMVSEGVDIPRLRVLVYATNVVTKLSFQQIVGRVIRGPEPPAVVYLPKDPKLLDWAKEMRNDRIEATREVIKQIDEVPPSNEKPRRAFQAIRAETHADGVIHAEDHLTETELNAAREQIRAEGALGAESVEMVTMVAKVLRRQQRFTVPEEPTPTPAPDSPLLGEQKEALRQAMNKLVGAYCWNSGETYATVNAELNAAVGIARLREATLEQARRRYELAKERCQA
jgi:superfamily II DNA or RNA helicase